ncbi:MAG: DUF473 domain-containing protein [Methanoregula sp.]|uniref:DUF473 domain-containing protein n=1 Tax=Methanoregula sp. TaxID=2052170 RepID=UPI0025FB4139|nr:DUF473 domain-containing protein [Methanoregula sp.]MCK9630027.1 DUF473 domain-containing protein [Methanoregula sp.]
MKCAALTSISPEIIRDLKAGRPRTIELQSTNNIITIASVEPGPETHIFMTSIDIEDLSPGDAGICVFLLATSLSMKRIVEFSHGGMVYEERERMSARVQVKFCATSVIKEVFHEGLMKPTEVEVLKSSCYHAG